MTESNAQTIRRIEGACRSRQFAEHFGCAGEDVGLRSILKLGQQRLAVAGRTVLQPLAESEAQWQLRL